MSRYSEAVKADVRRRMSPPQRHQIRDATPVPQLLGRRDLSSMSRLASETHVAGHDPHAAGVSQKWFGSIHHHRKTNSNHLS